MDDDDGASAVSLVTSVESVVTVATGVESVELGRLEDEVDHMVEVEDHREDVGDEVVEDDFNFGGFHPVRSGACLTSR